MFKKLRGFFWLSRPVNVCIAFFSVFVAVLICGTIESMDKVWLACLTAAFITAAANAVNDYYDLDIDRINRPKRPIPSGAITSFEALVFSGLFFVSKTTQIEWLRNLSAKFLRKKKKFKKSY